MPLSSRHRAWGALALIVAVGAALRFWNLGAASLWLDEVASIKFASLPWTTLWLSGYDNAPPLHYSLVKLCLEFADTEFSVRLPSALFGTLTIPLVYVAASRIAGRAGGLLAAMLLALSAGQIEYAQEARGYALLAFGLAVALLGLVMVMAAGSASPTGRRADAVRESRRGTTLYAAGILIALYTNNIAVFFVFFTQLAFALSWWLWSARDPRVLWRWLAVNALVFVLWLPWLVIVVTELLGNGTMAWLPHADPDRAFTVWRQLHGLPYLWYGQPWVDVLLLALAAYGAYRLRARPAIATLLVLLAGVAPLTIWAIGFVQPLFIERTVAWTYLGTPLLLAAALPDRRAWVQAALVALIGLAAARSAVAFHQIGATQNEDWRAAADAWHAASAATDRPRALLICSPTVAMPFAYYALPLAPLPPVFAWGLADSGFTSTPLPLGGAAATAGSRVDELRALPDDLFRWKRGAVDRGRRPMPVASATSAAPTDDAMVTLGVVTSHCPDDARAALEGALTAAGWTLLAESGFDGGELRTYRCARDLACALP
ncbi:MAG: glycosyltransferase family 39 protein [Gammaproteobacteria bacterium]|nr:glycosyltransferase family 39 protein [Gammaproteobacteria bacterium]